MVHLFAFRPNFRPMFSGATIECSAFKQVGNKNQNVVLGLCNQAGNKDIGPDRMDLVSFMLVIFGL